MEKIIKILNKLSFKTFYKKKYDVEYKMPFGIYYLLEDKRIYADNKIYDEFVKIDLEIYYGKIEELLKIKKELKKILEDEKLVYNYSDEIEINQDINKVIYTISFM